jgi:hypothetical protein
MIELALTPAVKLQLIGLIKGAIALGGWDLVTGAMPNNKMKRLSTILRAVNFTIEKVVVGLTVVYNTIDKVQRYGTDKV